MLAPGAPAPEVSLSSGGGDGGFTLAGTPGPVLLVFFKASCPTCQFTFPYLERIARGASGLTVAGVSQDGAQTAAQFAEAFGVTFPVYLDDAGAGYPASNAYGIQYVPSLFLVEDGRVTEAVSGFSRAGLEGLARRFGAPSPFAPGEKVPDFRPG